MKRDLKYFLCIAMLLMFFQLNAQVQFSIAVDVKEIGRKDELQVDYIISGTNKASNFKPPYFNKWKVISGPDFSSMSYDVNGKKDQLIKYSYVLVPQTSGSLKLPGTSVEANNKKLVCNDVVINVKKQDHVDGVPPPGSSLMFQGGLSFNDDAMNDDAFAKEYILKPGEDAVKKMRSNLFVKAVVSKNKVYVGEPVLVTYKLYTRLKSHSRVVKQPTFTGCSVHEMTTDDVLPVKENINGKVFNSYLIRQVQLFPLQPGKMNIGVASVENTVTFLSKSSDLRNLYYDEQTGNEQNVTLTTDPISIEVIPLPKDVTTHAVGDFKISAKLKKDTIAANETNALIITIEGRGNFRSLNEPEINWSSNMYHFDATETDDIEKLSFPLTGKRVYEIPFEVNTTGKFNIAPVALSFFNPNKANVQNIHTEALQLTVTPAVKTNVQSSVASVENSGFDMKLLLYFIPIIFIAGTILILRNPKRKLQTVVPIEEAKQPVAASPVINVQEKYNNLLLVQGDSEFYRKARAFAKEMIQCGKGDEDILLQVLQDCNTMLYTPLPTTSKKEVLDKLQKAIA